MTQPSVATLDPQVIPAGPLILPPQRRVMIFLLLALATLLQVATCGWGPIGNGADGFNAAMSREMALGLSSTDISQMWSLSVQPTPVQWVTMKSFQIFNVSEWSARLPFAVANLLIVALVFLIAERMGGVWRGLAAGIMAATTSGPILHGRDGGGAALVALAFTIAFYAAMRMLEQKSLLRWQWLFWVAIGALLLLKTPGVAIVSVVAVWVAFARFREARIRLRSRWWIAANAAFVILLMLLANDVKFASPKWENASIWRYLWMLFPWSIVMLPPCFLRSRKVLRLYEFTPQEAVVWSLLVLGTFWALLFPSHEEWPVPIACLVPVFAVLSSLIWDRLNCQNRMIGVALLVVLAIGGMGFCERVAGKDWLNLLSPIWWLSSGVITVFGIAALVALFFRHSRAALLTIAASTIPLSYNLLDARARFDWQHTLQGLSNQVDAGYLPETRVYLDEAVDEVGSFLFYAPHGLRFEMGKPIPAPFPKGKNYLLTRRENLSHWPGAARVGMSREHVLLQFPVQ